MSVDLNAVFQNFSGGHAEMEGSKFAKFTKDCGLISKTITTTEVDMVFAKVKQKAARKITADEFCMAVQMLASKEHSKLSPEEALEKIKAKIGKAGEQPKMHGTTQASKNAITEKLTDTSQYTGAHKHRFNEDGTGKGAAGRDAPATKDLSQITNRKEAGVRGV